MTRPDPLTRLLARRTITDDGCWIISGANPKSGYAFLEVDSQRLRAHRFMYEVLVGPIPEGLSLDHLCRRRACANPEHLEPVTHAENVLRGVSFAAANAAKEACERGHSLKDAYIVPSSGKRQCRECVRIRQAALRRRRGMRPRKEASI